MFNPYQPFELIPVFENIPLSNLLQITGKHDTNPKNQNRTKIFKAGDKKVQGWLNFSCRNGYIPCLDVVPSQTMLTWIAENMLQIDYDQIYFEAIPFADGKVKLYAKYNQIIGSRFLGWFDSAEFELK